MGTYTNLKSTINTSITTNGRKEITGRILNAVLTSMVDEVGKGSNFGGLATPQMATPDRNLFYFATALGTYSNFDGAVVQQGDRALFYHDGLTWKHMMFGADSPSIIPWDKLPSDVAKKTDIAEEIENYDNGIREYVDTKVGETDVPIKEYIDTKVGETDVPIKEYIDTKVGETDVPIKDYVDTEVERIDAKVNGIIGGGVVGGDYYTKSETDGMVGEIDVRVDNLENIIIKDKSALTFSLSPTLVESRVAYNTSFSWNFKFNSVADSPTTVVLKEGATVLKTWENVSSGTFVQNGNVGAKSYSLSAEYKGLPFSKTGAISERERIFYGCTKSFNTVTDLAKNALQSSASGTFTVNIAGGDYLYICIPSTMSLNGVTDKKEGFGIPMVRQQDITVDRNGAKVTYKVYKSENSFLAGSLTYVVS